MRRSPSPGHGLDRTVKDSDHASELAGAPVIGVILRDEKFGKTHLMQKSGSARVAEDYRQLRTNLQFLNVDDPPKVIMISSAVPSEGKTTAVVNLGLALADAGRTVTIVEADLRRPKVTRYLGWSAASDSPTFWRAVRTWTRSSSATAIGVSR